ncbi:NAD(P)H-hydrate dehydratase [Bdellovibrio sp. 22V]|uniref:NAD(P)H-hydrate dehydratase n=1 Tax=Bdellovibrio sp. 22V TaxID=3044166 RepID=UPI002543CFDE|nr:NAD(P)H-hydrate dehydratase [Bdellovibrio sp. 22V]WII73589.1 NAD(P)H-hydrate dehydratase [Bdellovibrio sp. 22V]
MEKANDQKFILKKKAAGKLLPAVSVMDNKASRGRSLLLAGSAEYPGAGILAAKAALRMGSGYVTLAQKNISVSSLENPDFLLCDLAKTSWEDLKFDSVLVGPGFGVNSVTAEIVRRLKEKKIAKVILDADAITVCAQENIFPLPPTWIVTPHTGELARCLHVSAEEINSDRRTFARKAQELFQCVVLLKGHRTLIANSRHTYTISSGNAALAKSGTGDVLAGIITALRAQGLAPTKAALLGAYVHGATANLWASRQKDLLSMTASDVIEYIPDVLYKLRHQG